MVAMQVLARVDNERLQRGVEGLTHGDYRITLAQQSEAEIRGFVTNGDKTEYGVVLSEGQVFCSCPDAMYRRNVCKHAVALALYAIRTPQQEQPQQAQSWHVGDTVQRNGHTGRVTSVSGEYISVRWDTGRIAPMTREELLAA